MKTRPLKGEIALPGDKSISHRAVMFSSIANGESVFTNLSNGADVKSTIDILKKLGSNIEFDDGTLRTKSTGLHSLAGKDLALDCGNSGTSLRLLSGFLCGQDVENVSLVGDESLSRRPHDRVINPLQKLGVNISGRDGCYTPVVLSKSEPIGGRIEMEIASAQVKSAVLLSGLYSKNPTTVIEHEHTRNHSEIMLKKMGAQITVSGNGSNVESTIHPIESDLQPISCVIPGDPSSAAFFGVAASIIPDSEIVIRNLLLNEHRIGWIKVLIEMGANIQIDKSESELGEIVGDVYISSSELHGVDISTDIASMVDELPILSLAMVFANGTSKVSNAKELRVKESDRISVVVDHLDRAGVQVNEFDDGYEIFESMPKSCEIKSNGDHRIAMTFAILNYISTGEMPEVDKNIISTSFPGFFDLFKTLID
ncbi:MAG: 3-phosphoshikimate 1-carboxyvinyltransferase [Acidimicrobiia bacterium]